MSIELKLPAEPKSARLSRDFVREGLLAADMHDVVIEKVVLMTSELVTNAVLHGRGPIVVKLHTDADYVRVEVDDSEPVLPTIRGYGEDAATGRGLPVVEMTATAWGTRAGDDGKSVWFEVGVRPSTSSRPVGSLDTDDDEPPPPAAVRVRIRRLPLAVYLQAQKHNDELLREFALIQSSGRRDSLPSRLQEVIDLVSVQLGTQSAASRRQIEDALERGDRVVDLVLWLPPNQAPIATRLVALLDEVDEFCRAGALLTVPGSAEVRRFRAWYLDQVLRQLEGAPSTPWEPDPRA